MAFGFLRSTPLLDEASIHWMFDSFEWALRNFDAEVFYHETRLINPTNEHFPGAGDNAFTMASLIFDKTKDYAGLKHWPFKLVDESSVDRIEIPKISIEGALRGSKGLVPSNQSEQFIIPVNLGLLRDPEVLIATYAHSLSHYLGTKAQQDPPGGVENWPHVTELLAVFLGFGLIMANTAYTHKIRSCASCSGPSVERSNYLSQYDITYALAIFCNIKKIPTNDALQHVKKTLRPFFKKAVKDVQSRTPQLETLLSYATD
jgi:hypothetical protein